MIRSRVLSAVGAASIITVGLAPTAYAMPEEEVVEVVASGPEAIVQQIGLAEVGSCDKVDDTALGLNWAGVASGGWTLSWAEWVDGGKGGEVCTRTLAYDQNLNEGAGGWHLAPAEVPAEAAPAEAPVV